MSMGFYYWARFTDQLYIVNVCRFVINTSRCSSLRGPQLKRFYTVLITRTKGIEFNIKYLINQWSVIVKFLYCIPSHIGSAL